MLHIDQTILFKFGDVVMHGVHLLKCGSGFGFLVHLCAHEKPLELQTERDVNGG